MSVHNNNIKKSIDLNIIGTANIVKVCEKLCNENDSIQETLKNIEPKNES